MGDQNETTGTSGFFSSFLDGDDTDADAGVEAASVEVLAADDVAEVLGSEVAAEMATTEPKPEVVPEVLPESGLPEFGSGVDETAETSDVAAGRDWTFLLAWALIGIGLLFVVWALMTNG